MDGHSHGMSKVVWFIHQRGQEGQDVLLDDGVHLAYLARSEHAVEGLALVPPFLTIV
jgi:hypothetical protein